MKVLRTFLCLMLCTMLLAGCAAPPPPPASPTLPPAAPGPEAPIGDAALRQEAIIPLHLPARDGQTLLTVFETLNLPMDQHPAQSILTALLTHPGNSRVQPLGGQVSLTLYGANPVEISGSVCTVNLSAGALQTLHAQAFSIFRGAITDTLHDAMEPVEI